MSRHLVTSHDVVRLWRHGFAVTSIHLLQRLQTANNAAHIQREQINEVKEMSTNKPKQNIYGFICSHTNYVVIHSHFIDIYSGILEPRGSKFGHSNFGYWFHHILSSNFVYNTVDVTQRVARVLLQ